MSIKNIRLEVMQFLEKKRRQFCRSISNSGRKNMATF